MIITAYSVVKHEYNSRNKKALYLPRRHSDLIGHLRSKVKVPTESPVMTSYLKLIVTVCLSGTVFKILAVLRICLLS